MPATREDLDQREREEDERIEELGEVVLKILREKKPLLLTQWDLTRVFMKRRELRWSWFDRIMIFLNSLGGLPPNGLFNEVGEIIEQLIEKGKAVEPKPGWYGLPDA